MLKKILIGLGVVIVLLIAAVLIIPAFVPVDTYKEQLTAQVKTATGRDLVIEGDVDLSLFPTLGIQVDEVSFSNAEGAKQPQMATLSRMVVALKLLPLLSGGIEVDKFVLVDPVIHLEVDKQGNPNWQFDGMAAQPAAEEGDQPKDGGAGDGAGDGALPIQQISLGEVGIQNGTVTYVDGKSGQEVVLSKINMNLDLPSIDDPLVADGRVTWNNEEVALKLRVENPRKLIEGDKSALDMNVNSKPVNLAFNGSLTNGQPLSAGGAVDLDVPSVRGLAAWTGNPLDFPGSGFGPLKVKGNLGLAGPKVSFADAQITFDQINGKGEMAVDGGGAVPYIMAKLAVDKLDLNPYMPPGTSSGAASDSAGGDASGSAGGSKPAGGGSKGWSNEPIDASGLRAVNADLAFSSGEILIQKIKIDRGAVAVKLRGGKLALDLTDLQLYGGKGRGQVNVDASGKSLAIKESFSLAGIQARPLLTDAADTDWLEGAGGFQLNVTGRGNSQRQIVSSLNGNGDFKFLNGAIHGINIAEIMRRVGSGDITAVFDPDSLGEAQKTDFAELSGTYVIRNGILSNNDTKMLSPLLRITGAGTVSMPPKTLDYRIEPKLVGSLQGQGGAQDLKGLAVPMNIRGPWDNFQVEPDFAAMFSSNPKALLDTLSKGGLKVPELPGVTGVGADVTKEPEKAVEGLIKGVLGGGDTKKAPASGDGGGDAGAEPKDPIKSIKKLFD